MMTWSPAPGIEIADASEQTRPPGDGLEMLAVRGWRAAEGRLYPLITVDAGMYEEAVTLVREAADVLRACCADVTALIDADPRDVLARCPSASAWMERGLSPATVFDAARAVRWRELTPDRGVGSQGANPGDPR
jgi:hypothetical protein